MNLPNKLSIVRILLVPIILLFLLPIHFFSFEPEAWNTFINNHGYIIAGVLFIIASLTDMIDGKIARKYNLITDLGKFLDSLADKMLVVSVMIALVALGRLSAILVIIIVFREFMVTGVRLVASGKGVVMAAKILGKIKAALQMIAISFILFEPLIIMFGASFGEDAYASFSVAVPIIGNILFFASVVMAVYSGIDYLVKSKKFFIEN